MRQLITRGDRSGYEPQPKAGRFDQISIALHWLSVALVTEQITTAWLLDRGIANPAVLLTVHRSGGSLTWIVVAMRFVWRHYFAHLPAFSASMPRLQQQIAKLNEYALYGLLLVQPLSGLAMMLSRGRPFTLCFWQVPILLDPAPTVSSVFRSVHEIGAWGLLTLIGLHAAAALLHGFVLRDGVLQRMLPWTVR